MSLVLSLFPGIGLLDMAFEEEGFCVVRGPDLLWGGDIRRFHPPAGKFDGVIGGPPCQAFSSLVYLIKATGGTVAPNLIPEFERVVSETQPAWFLMENVRAAPLPVVAGYIVDAPLYDNRWIGGAQSRLHRFSFGTKEGHLLAPHLEFAALESAEWSHRVLASGGYRPAPLEGGNGSYRVDGEGRPIRKSGGALPHSVRATDRARFLGWKTTEYFREARRLQGLSPDWDLPGFTVKAKIQALGNAVPLPMGRALARAVKRALRDAGGPAEKTRPR